MAHISKYISWAAGEGTPSKYDFAFDADVSVESVVDGIATIRIKGTMGVQNHPLNSRNSFKASDFATLGIGNMNLRAAHNFTYGVSYYQYGLPCIPDGDQSIRERVLFQFRGDTWINDPANSRNRSSLYSKQSGLLLNAYDGEAYQSFPLDMTFTMDVHTGGDIPVLTWTTSGSNSATDTTWLTEQTWLSWFQIDYRPGERKINGRYKSLNRPSGKCERKGYGEMRTVDGGVGTTNPPSRKHNGIRYNMRKIGEES